MARVSSSTFVARKRELEAMTAAVIGSSSGAPLLTLVIGEAGVGKTRLVREVGAAAESAGAQVITGGCVPLGSGTVPFAPIREAMRDLATRRTERELEDLLGTARDELVSLVPSLGAAAAHSSQDAPQQGRMYELILGLFERMAAEGPTVIVLEDLHWADRSTIGLLSFLIRNVRAPGLRLIGTLRSDEVDRRDPLYAFLAETRRSERVTRVELRRFDRAETAELLRGILGTEPPAALADSVHRRSGGNAFFAEELVAASAEAGDVPDTLREVLLVRVGHLSDPTQRLLRIVAAAGRSVSAARLADVAGLPPDRVAATVQEAVAQQVLLVETGDEGEDRYLFRHALVQEAIEQELLPGERRRLHAAFATSLTDHPPASDAGAEAELAYHWFAAGDLPRAFAASLRAAESAEQGYAFAEAHAAYERALDLWDQVPAELRSGTDRIGILQRAAAAAAATQQFPEAVRLIQSAIEAVDGDPVRAGVLHERLGRYSLLAADTPQADAAYREAVRLVPSHPPTAERGRVVAGLAHYLMGAHNDEAIALCGEAIEVARTLGANEIEANALITRAGCRVGTGDLDGALEDATRGYELAVLIPGSVEAARAQKYLSEIHSVSGNDELAIDAATRGFDEAERLGLARSEGFAVLSSLASHLLGAGRWDEADVVMRRMERLGVSGWNALPFHDIHAHLDLARGHVDAAARHVAAAERLEEGDVEGEYEVNLINLRAQLAMAQGRAGAVARIVDEGLASLGDRDQWPGPMMWTFYQAVRADAEVAAQARRRRRAAEERQAIDAAERHAAQVRSVVEAIPPAHWETRDAEAMTALANAELGRARGIDDPLAWATSADAWAAARRLPQVEAYARWRAGAAYLTKPGADGRAAARAQLVRAREIAVALKAAPLREDVERVAARAHLPLTDAAATSTPSPGPGDLTVRELEVLELVAAGQSNRQIGESLFITEKTAGVHVSNVLGKLGVSRRTEAVAVARERGLL